MFGYILHMSHFDVNNDRLKVGVFLLKEFQEILYWK